MASVLSELSGEPLPDPDAHATLTDFIDYTDYFPSDLKRSLTLIGRLDKAAQEDYDVVHRLTKIYGTLPTLPIEDRPNPQTLRADISHNLAHALRSRESAFAEASRLCNVSNNLYARLVNIHRKLASLPKPPSRDPTPVPQPRSPLTGRGRKADNERAPRITLFSDGVKATNRDGARPKHRSRRIIVPGEVLPPFDPISPGVDYSESESDRAPSLVVLPAHVEKSLKEKVQKPPKPMVMKLPKAPGPTGPAVLVRPRAPGVMGTNVHSTVAGISVSNAMALLEPPPPDPIPGSRHAPWNQLTEWELNKLRKRMKKNANWMPSATMIRRELLASGRGSENLKQAKTRAAAGGELVLDENAANSTSAVVMTGELIDDGTEDQLLLKGMKLNEAKKAKREALAREQAPANVTEQASAGAKKQADAEAQAALAAAEILETGRRITDAARAVETLFANPPADLMIDPILLLSPPVPLVEPSKHARKRKRDTEASPSGGRAQVASPKVARDVSKTKKLKLVLPTVASALPPAESSDRPQDQIILDPSFLTQPNGINKLSPTAQMAPPESSLPSLSSSSQATLEELIQVGTTPAIKLETALLQPSGSRTIRTSHSPVTLQTSATLEKQEKSLPEPVADRPRLRGNAPIISLTLSSPKKAASAEPSTRRISLRRSSNASMPSSKVAPSVTEPSAGGATRRSGRSGKRPTPGLVTSHNDEGGAKVSVGARRAAPSRVFKKAAVTVVLKKSTARRGSMPTTPVVEEYFDVDPDEPKYCICGDVSYGTMVACEADDCELVWFHLACVGLAEAPRRRQTWYCPDCRVRLRVSEDGQKV